VGRISVDGTLGFVVFTGLFVGLATGTLYLLLHRWLPAGRAGGLAYGALLLVVAATRIDPLRRGNPDFDLVGPGWASVLAFAGLVVFHGVLVAALAGRLSRAVPLLGAGPRAIAAHAPLLLLLLLGTAGLVVAIEPMVNAGGWETRLLADEWTVVTADGSLSAHFEHTVAVTEDGPAVLTAA